MGKGVFHFQRISLRYFLSLSKKVVVLQLFIFIVSHLYLFHSGVNVTIYCCKGTSVISQGIQVLLRHEQRSSALNDDMQKFESFQDIPKLGLFGMS